MRQRIITIAIGVLSAVSGFAQESARHHYLDSLRRELDRAPVDSTRIILLETLALEYSNTDPAMGLDYAFKANALAKKLGLPNREAATLTVIATNYSSAGEIRKGLEYNKRSLEMYRQMNNARGMAATYANLGQDYLKIGDYRQALECNLEALKHFEGSTQHRNRAIVLDNIADIYYQLRNFPKSKQYSTDALSLYRKYGSDRDVARCLGNASRACMDLGEYDKALGYLTEALRINRFSGDESSVLINLTNIGLVYMKTHRYDEAQRYLRRSLKLSVSLHSSQYIAVNEGNIAGCFVEQYKYEGGKNRRLLDSAVVYFSNALKLCNELSFTGPTPEFMGGLVEAYALKGNYRKAYRLQAELMLLQDSLNRLSSGDKIAALEAKRELDLRDKDIIIKERELKIESLKSQHRTMIYGMVILVNFVLLVLLFRYMRRKTRRQHAFISEIRQMQSHDLRGPVATILGLTRLLKKEARSEKSRRELIDGIEEMSLRLNQVVLKVVDNSKKLDER